MNTDVNARPPLLRRLRELNARLSWSWLTKGVPVILWLIGLYYTIRLFFDMQSDTTAITNVAFGIVASLSALSFAAARTLEQTDPHRDRITYAGERFLHGVVLLLSASLVKYTALSIGLVPVERGPMPFLEWLYFTDLLALAAQTIIGITVGVLFFFAMNFAHTGLRVLSNVLWHRVARHRDWDDFY